MTSITNDHAYGQPRWEILTFTLCDGWVNTWTVMEAGKPERPETFASREYAEQALAAYLEEARIAAEAGDLAEAPDPGEHLVSRVRYADTTQIEWQGILIDVRYEPYWLGDPSDGDDGYDIAHLEIVAKQPERARLPMTETGYRSHFTSRAEIDSHGGPVAFVQQWLDAVAATPAWRAHVQAARQMSLF
jgi:hypothetical protein